MKYVVLITLDKSSIQGLKEYPKGRGKKNENTDYNLQIISDGKMGSEKLFRTFWPLDGVGEVWKPQKWTRHVSKPIIRHFSCSGRPQGAELRYWGGGGEGGGGGGEEEEKLQTAISRPFLVQMS